MNIPELNLTADAIRKQLPFVCKKDDGSFKSQGAIKNIVSGFNQMLKLGLLSEDQLIEQMESEFKLIQNKVLNYSKTNSNAKSWSSFLNDIRGAINSIVNFDTSGMTFGETLLVISKREFGVHLSVPKLSAELARIGQSASTAMLSNWLNNKATPCNKRSYEIVNQLDLKLNANGALISKIKPINKECILDTQKYDTNTVEFSDALEAELAMYIAWSIDGTKPKEMSYLKAGGSTNKVDKRKIRQLQNVKNKKWQFDAKGDCTGAATFRSDVQAFAKFLRDEHPELLEGFSLSSMFNYELVKEFSDYGVNKGVIPSTMRVLKRIQSECGKNTYASVYLYSEDKSTNNIDEWLQELELLKDDIKFSLTLLGTNNKALEGSRNVNWIIDKSNSFDYINAISKGLWELASFTADSYADSCAAMIFDLLTISPIRASNVCALQWKGELSDKEVSELQKEETCAVYWDLEKGLYVLFVHKQKLKNRRSSKISSIIQELSHLTNEIHLYINARKQHLLNREWCSSFFFLAVSVQGEKPTGYSYQRSDITNLLSSKTKTVIDLYFPEENVLRGINPHGMRHLMATLFLRYNNENYSALATLLMDDLTTVMGVYAKRSDNANHEKISAFIGEMTNA